ncbi:ArnT family glycosyltransferase [Desulfobacca acetoxidans]
MPRYATRLVPILVWTIVIFCSFHNLRNFPTIWWDEAIFSETAANLAQKGRYAFTIESPDKLSDFDYRISAGPVIIAPVALAYYLFEVDIFYGRLVAGVFLCLAFVLLYLSARCLLPRGPSLLSVLLTLGTTDILYWGRSVMGDIPAITCFLGGIFFVLKGLQEERRSCMWAAGCCLGLAVAAKEFYGLALFPVLATLGWTYRRRLLELTKTAGVLLLGFFLPLVVYLIVKAFILGGLLPALNHFYVQKKLLCHEFFTPMTIGRFYPESFAYLLTHPLFITGLIGFWLYQRRNGWSPSLRYWFGNLSLWGVFYLLAVYWQRFALPVLILSSPFAGYLLIATFNALSEAAALRRFPMWAKISVLSMMIALVFPLSIFSYLPRIMNSADDSPHKLVDYLQRSIPNDVLIETPEYELVFLDDDHRYHLMPAFYFVESTPDKIVLHSPETGRYDFAKVKADLLILGSFGKSVFRQIYPWSQVRRYYKKISTIDYYDIYLRRDSNLGRQVQALGLGPSAR